MASGKLSPSTEDPNNSDQEKEEETKFQHEKMVRNGMWLNLKLAIEGLTV